LLHKTDKKSAVGYSGKVYHERLLPKLNNFYYHINMDYFDIDNHPTGYLLYHDTQDYLFKNSSHINYFINKTNYTINKVMLLTNIKYFFSSFNPISIYFCYDNDTLYHIIAEVSNIPWFEKTYYIMDIDKNGEIITNTFDKNMHVSPFNPPRGQQYKFDYQINDKYIFFKVSVYENEKLIVYAYMNLYETKFIVFRNFRSIKTMVDIHIQALFLWLKKFPLYTIERMRNQYHLAHS